MLKVILVMLSGIICGYLMRSHQIGFASRVIMVAIYALLLFLGIQVGHNPQIMENLSTLGLEALIITIGALLGTLLAAKFVYNKFFKSSSNER